MYQNNLKKILKERGIKQNWLAEKTKIKEPTLSNIIKGKCAPTMNNAKKIMDVLGISFEEVWVANEINENNDTEK